MVKRDKKANWTIFFFKKNILDKKANNFLKIGQLCAKNELILGTIPKISSKSFFFLENRLIDRVQPEPAR